MPITFGDSVPRWLRAIVRRWARILGHVDWSITVKSVSQEDLRTFTGTTPKDEIDLLGGNSIWTKYLQAEIQFHDQEPADVLDDYAAHELLHIHYDEFYLLFDRLWDKRRKVSREEARAQLDHLIEERIQRHVRQLQRARGRRA